jgi:Spy/CpxP family protein refolding chaperone
MNSWKIILATLVIFGAGVVTGGLLVNYVEHTYLEDTRRLPPEASPRPQGGGHDQSRPANLSKPRAPEMWSQEFVGRLNKTLQLTPEQRDAIQKIIADGQRQNSEIWSNAVPQMRQVMQEARQHIRELLTPDQRKQFEALFKQPRGGGRHSPPSPNPPLPTNPPPEPPTNAPLPGA